MRNQIILQLLLCVFSIHGCTLSKGNPAPPIPMSQAGLEAVSSSVTNETSQKMTNHQHPGNSSFMLIATHDRKDNTVSVSHGMGVAVLSDNDRCLVLTNKHLIENTKKIRLVPWTGKPCPVESCQQEGFAARIISQSEDIDAAILEIKKTNGCNSSPLVITENKTGTALSILGQPVLGKGAMSRGIVSGYWEIDGQGLLMVSDVLTMEGFSGSGVYDEDQNLIGLVTGKTADKGRGFAYIIPNTRLLPFLKLNRIIR